MNKKNNYIYTAIGRLEELEEASTFLFLDLYEYDEFKELNNEDKKSLREQFHNIITHKKRFLGIEPYNNSSLDTEFTYINRKDDTETDKYIGYLRGCIGNLANICIGSKFRFRHLFSLNEWTKLTEKERTDLENDFKNLICTELIDVTFTGETYDSYKRK